MEMTRTRVISVVSAVWFSALRAISKVTVPFVLAASSRSDSKIELMRANTIYKNPDPKPWVQVGLSLQRQMR